MLYSTFAPPSDAEHARIAKLDRTIRVFDTNIHARENGYHVHGADLCELPVVDPHGTPWALLLDDELEARKSWCMLPEQHDALSRELRVRAEYRTVRLAGDGWDASSITD